MRILYRICVVAPFCFVLFYFIFLSIKQFNIRFLFQPLQISQARREKKKKKTYGIYQKDSNSRARLQLYLENALFFCYIVVKLQKSVNNKRIHRFLYSLTVRISMINLFYLIKFLLVHVLSTSLLKIIKRI